MGGEARTTGPVQLAGMLDLHVDMAIGDRRYTDDGFCSHDSHDDSQCNLQLGLLPGLKQLPRCSKWLVQSRVADASPDAKMIPQTRSGNDKAHDM